MKKMKYLILPLFILTIQLLPAESGRDIIKRVIDSQEVSSSAMDMQMSLVDRGEVMRTMRFQSLMRDDNGLTKTITLFLEPASVKNTRFLTVENEKRNDDQWIYLPALRKVKRIASSEKGGSFMGSDFSYADMSLLGAMSLDDSKHTLLKEESFMGHDWYVVESVTKPSVDSVYRKKVTWVDKTGWYTVKVEFYSAKGNTKVKELISEDFKLVQDRWTAGTITMKTMDSGHSTILNLVQVKYDIPMKPSFFTTRFLETGRAQ